MKRTFQPKKRQESKEHGFFKRLVSGLTKTRNQLTESLNQIFHGHSELDDDFYDDVPPVRRRPRPSEDDSFATRRQRLERPSPVQSGDEPNFPGRRRMREPVKPEGEPAPAANPAPAAPATEDKPRQKTRQEIYQDIAAKYV